MIQRNQQQNYQMNQLMMQDNMRLEAGRAANRTAESIPNSTYFPPNTYYPR